MITVCNVQMGSGLDRHRLNTLWIDAMDSPTENLSRHFERANHFIDSARAQGGVVYVHCGYVGHGGAGARMLASKRCNVIG